MENMEKVARFEAAINREAELKIKALLSDAEEKAEEAVAYADNKYLEETYDFVSSETRNIKRRLEHKVSQKSFESSRELFSHRSRAVEKFFEELAEEIRLFSETPEYERKLSLIIDEIKKESGLDETCIIYVKTGDVEKVKRLYPNIDVKADKNISLGGATVFYPEKSIYTDRTFDNAFAQQKADFVSNDFMRL